MLQGSKLQLFHVYFMQVETPKIIINCKTKVELNQ